MSIKINERWRLEHDRLQYILWETLQNDPDNPRTKKATREVPTYHTKLDSVLAHIAEYEPRTKKLDTYQDLLKAVQETNTILKDAAKILRDQKLPFYANQELHG